MSSALCKALLDEWIVENYDNPETALGKWKRTSKFKNAEDLWCRAFYNRVIDETTVVKELKDGTFVLMAPNGYEFEMHDEVLDDGSASFYVARVGYPDDPGNRQNGNCNGYLPSGMYEESESGFVSDFDIETTRRLLKQAGFVEVDGWW
jgi:hypothetical protein